MKQLIEKDFGWLKDSNHLKHMTEGVLVYAATMAICIMLGGGVSSSAVVSLATAFIVPVAVNYKDNLWGKRFDRLDVAITLLFPRVITLLVCIIF